VSEDTINLSVQARTVNGKAVKRLRADGIVPAVIHNHGKDSIHVQAEYNDLAKVYRAAGRHHPVELTADGKKYLAIIKNATFDPKKNRLNHVVFNAINANQKVEADVPIKPRYDGDNESSPAERQSLIVLANLEEVAVSAVPSKLPDALYYNAEKLVEIGDRATVADLDVPEGVEVLTDADHTIATVYEPSALAAANDEAGGDEEATAEDVDAEQGGDTDQSSSKDEQRPGGKKEFEDKDQGHNPEQK
jgi:large subunit ribosomal protein L25